MFYYLLAGASEEERKAFHLLKPEEYHYLNQVGQPLQTMLDWININKMRPGWCVCGQF